MTATAFTFLHSVEFYVVMTVVAAAVLALCVRPSQLKAAVRHSVGGWMTEGDYDIDEHLRISCGDDGSVTIRRAGLRGMYVSGGMSLEIEQRGFDLEIRERRITGGMFSDCPATEAVFVLTFLAPEWYHIKYTSDPGSRFAAFSLHVRPGLTMDVPLKE